MTKKASEGLKFREGALLGVKHMPAAEKNEQAAALAMQRPVIGVCAPLGSDKSYEILVCCQFSGSTLYNRAY